MIDGRQKPLLRKIERSSYDCNFYTPIKANLDSGHLEHTMGCGDLYCSSKLAFKDKLEKWIYKPNLKKDLNLIAGPDVRPDMFMRLNSANFFIEYDRSEDIGKLADKVMKYETLYHDNSGYFFYVLIICDNYESPSGLKKFDAQEKMDACVKMLHRVTNGTMKFFVTTKEMYDLLPALVAFSTDTERKDDIFINRIGGAWSLLKLRSSTPYSNEPS